MLKVHIYHLYNFFFHFLALENGRIYIYIYIYILQSRTLLRISKGIISHVLKVCKIYKIIDTFINYYIYFLALENGK